MRILVIGHVDHGKTTFICALNNFLYTSYGIGSADRALPTVDENNCVTSQESVSYSIDDIDYTFVDYPGFADYLDMFEKGEEKFDAALIVCAACDGPMRETTELFKAAFDYGIIKYVIFMNKTDLVEDSELTELTTAEVRFVMDENGFFADDAPVVNGSALNALENPDSAHSNCIYEIIEAFKHVLTE